MRRSDREVTSFSDMLRVVDACDCCRLGMVDQGAAYIVPMNFGYEAADETLTLYFHSANVGKKLSLLPAQTAVSFEMDTAHGLVEGKSACSFSYWYQCVMGVGTAEILTDADARMHALRTIMRHYTGEEQWEFAEKALRAVTVFRLRVDRWSCKVHGASGIHGV